MKIMKNKIIYITIIVLVFGLVLIFYLPKQKCYEPTVSFTFDDSYKDQYDAAFPIFKEHNITAATYIVSGLVGDYFKDQPLMDWLEINELKNNGWEIGSHAVTHSDLTNLDKDSIRNELEKSKLALEDQSFVVKSLSIPYGKYNDEIKAIAKEYYDSVRPSVWGLNSFSNIDKYNLKSFWIANSTPLSKMKSWIDEAENNKSWLIIMVHHVTTDLSMEYSIHPDNLNKIINYIEEKNIKVKTVSEVLDQCV